MNFKAFFKECRDKQILKMLSIYVVASWILLQVLAITWEPIGLPAYSVTYLIILLLIAFPIYAFYIWRFRASSGELEHIESEEEHQTNRQMFQKIYYTLLFAATLICVVSIFLIVNNKFSTVLALPVAKETSKIAVLKFGNNTGNEAYDIVGKMAADWIVHGITENQVAQVISPEIISDYSNIIAARSKPEDEVSILKNYFKPSKIISGNVYLEGDNLILQASISGSDINETLIAFKNRSCNKNFPLECIEDLKQVIIGYLTTKDQPELNLQDTPPKFEAYQNVLNAKANYSNQETYIKLINKAILDDDSYFEPKVLRVGYYYNLGQYRVADSLREAINTSAFTNSRQRNLLNHYQALITGKNDKVYNTTKKEFEITPFDLQTNSGMMVVALQFVYRPEEVDSIYYEISMDGMDLQNCDYCKDRLFVKAYADIALKKYQAAINLLEPYLEITDDTYLTKPLISAYIRADKTEKLKELLSKLKFMLSNKDWTDLCLYIGNEYLLLNKKDEAMVYFKDIISSDFSTKEDRAAALYALDDFKSAKKLLEELYKENPKDINTVVKLAISEMKNNNSQKAEQLLSALNNLRSTYQYGSIDYALAQYYVSVNDKKNTFKYLKKSVGEGRLYKPETFMNDPHFLPYLNTQEFDDIMNFWK